MIAIAGSKGGCGKSTITLGLAEAFARADTPVLAIDADRQLPNLHVMTETDREPTLATLVDRAAASETTDIRDGAQQHPRASGVGIVPAPTPDQAFEFGSLAEHLDTESVQVFLDCPSGAGPSVVDPLRQADGVIVVATDSERSLTAAATTIEMARRLGVPIYGALLNRCSAVPEPATRWEGVPLLGCVPDRPSPLANDAVAAAFDDAVARLASQSPADRALQTYADDRLPLGTDAIDRHLGGGLEPGSLVAFVSPPASQGERLLHRATAVRGTLFLSTDRSRTTVRHELESTAVGTGTPTIRRVTGPDSFDDATSLIGKLPTAATLIIDPIDELERRDRSAYVAFLDTLTDRLAETDSIAILHCLGGTDDRATRSATFRLADAVFELEFGGSDSEPADTSNTLTATGTTSTHSLRIPKYRHDASVVGTIELEFSDGAGVEPIESPPRAEQTSPDDPGQSPQSDRPRPDAPQAETEQG
ncbi:DUF7125 family protein [Natrialba asiatica]|uniref:Chromosome partitioning ATPase n=1 Tax=Natrialba asiatica (strain ATCC 700177 / DSM 12278 / JCM 9576 / FERM P-10747 / NBRC 102637 / 172P1) TaxID=29540 RepID=M0B918_NATA1|nr:AAA family ATPase [Natrialba asiatica]ELZ06139.1 chromosome partitioning ATPase [Natrialba asiatica DSM 12278]